MGRTGGPNSRLNRQMLEIILRRGIPAFSRFRWGICQYRDMDRRVQRSRSQLQEALLELARERSLDEITVADITTRAGVNRSTFYQHYTDKDTLLADALEEAADIATDPLRELKPDHVPHQLPPELFAYLLHIRDNAALYRRVLGEHGSGVVASRLRQHLGAIAVEIISQVAPPGFYDVPIDIMGEALAGSAVGVVSGWLRREPLPPVEEAATWLWASIRPPEDF